MAANKKDTARKAAEGAWGHPYVQRVVQDAELRENVKSALESVRAAYDRLSSNGKPASKQLLDDKKLQKELKSAAESLKEAGQALAKGPKRRRGGFARVLAVGIVGAGLAVAFSENLRDKVLDKLFGSEEEFDYTAPGASAPETPREPASTGS